jgi:hypothetical protein
MGSVGLEFLIFRVDVSSVPVTVTVEIVVLCSCRDRADAFCVMADACFMLSLADCELASWAAKLVVVDPLMRGIPP